jgi:hypothetical protein
MEKYIVVTKTPGVQSLLGPTRGSVKIEEYNVADIDTLMSQTLPPLGGYCMFIKKDDVKFLTSKVTGESRPPDQL